MNRIFNGCVFCSKTNKYIPYNLEEKFLKFINDNLNKNKKNFNREKCIIIHDYNKNVLIKRINLYQEEILNKNNEISQKYFNSIFHNGAFCFDIIDNKIIDVNTY